MGSLRKSNEKTSVLTWGEWDFREVFSEKGMYKLTRLA